MVVGDGDACRRGICTSKQRGAGQLASVLNCALGGRLRVPVSAACAEGSMVLLELQAERVMDKVMT